MQAMMVLLRPVAHVWRKVFLKWPCQGCFGAVSYVIAITCVSQEQLGQGRDRAGTAWDTMAARCF
jgi:hypothetical protein